MVEAPLIETNRPKPLRIDDLAALAGQRFRAQKTLTTDNVEPYFLISAAYDVVLGEISTRGVRRPRSFYWVLKEQASSVLREMAEQSLGIRGITHEDKNFYLELSAELVREQMILLDDSLELEEIQRYDQWDPPRYQ